MKAVETRGWVAPGFDGVRAAFLANVAPWRVSGAACCVYLDGEPVVDLWGGVAEPGTGRAWAANTPVLLFSGTKGATAVCVNLLVQRGELDPDAPVAEYWPEFGANGKGSVPVSWALSHRAGIPVLDAAVTLDDIAGWDGVVAAVAAQNPLWTPGSTHGYHPRSWGWIAGELVRRTTGLSLGTFFAREVAGPLGLDFWIGLPAEIAPRLARVTVADSKETGGNKLMESAIFGPSELFGYDERWNEQGFLAPEIPSSNGVASARALARMYGATVGEIDGTRILEAGTIDRARRVLSDGTDRVFGIRTAYGLGFALPPTISRYCPPGTFGHQGAGGSLGFADPERRLSFGYVTSDLHFGPTESDEADRLVRALYAAL